MQTDPVSSTFSYRHGPLQEGILRVCNLLQYANSRGVQNILIEYADISKPTIPGVISAAGPDLVVFRKTSPSAFSDPVFVDFLRRIEATTLVVGGFNRTACVLQTIKDAIGAGYQVFTSDQLMFGTCDYDRPSKIGATFNAITFFRTYTNYFDTLDSLKETCFD